MSETATLFGRGAPGADYARDPYPYLARLSEETSRYYMAERDAWFMSARADIVALLRDERLTITPSSSFADQSSDFRSTVAKRLRAWFSASGPILTETVTKVTRQCAARLEAGAEVDLVDAVAHYVPSRVMAELLGIPAADLPPLQRLGERILESYDLDWSGRPRGPVTAPALSAYFQRLWSTASDTPLLRLLREAQSEQALPDASMIDTCSKLFTAGTTTTAGCLANIMAHLVGRVGEGSVSSDPGGVEDLLRWNSPILALKRYVRETVQLGDVTLAAGQKVYLLIGGVDNASIPTGERQGHSLTFGLGRYHCLGAALARLEVSAVLDMTAPIIPRLQLVEPVRWRESWLVHEARSIRVAITGATDAD